MTPVVSVRIMAYQNAAFIRQCVDSVLTQQTNFPIEICIGEDGPRDGTREICLDYQKDYPKVVRVFLWDRNVSQKEKLPPARYNFVNTLARCQGEYIALLDGDDYWTSPHKLQKQVDFLRNNPEYSMCFHNSVQKASNRNHIFPAVKENTRFTLQEFLHSNRAYSSSVVYRSSAITPRPSWFTHIPLGDYTMHCLALLKGDAMCLPDIMSVYRVHEGGVQSALRNSHSGEVIIAKRFISFYETIKRAIPESYHELVNKKIMERYRHINSLSLQNRNPFQFISNRYNLLLSEIRPPLWKIFFQLRI